MITDTPHNLTTQLTTSSGYQLEIAGNLNKITAVIADLQHIPGIIEAIALDRSQPNQPDLQSITIRCESDSQLGNQIAQLILDRGFKLYELRRTRPSLEDVFLELTTEEFLLPQQPSNLTITHHDCSQHHRDRPERTTALFYVSSGLCHRCHVLINFRLVVCRNSAWRSRYSSANSCSRTDGDRFGRN